MKNSIIHPIFFITTGLSAGLVFYCFQLFLPAGLVLPYILLGSATSSGVMFFFQSFNSFRASRAIGWKRLIPMAFSLSCMITTSLLWFVFIRNNTLPYPALYFPLGILMVFTGYIFSYSMHQLLGFVPQYKAAFDLD